MKNTSTLILYVSKSDNNPTNIVNMYRLEVFISNKRKENIRFLYFCNKKKSRYKKKNMVTA